ncbi:hypothetical protein BDQ94DRAFT_151183 [Aspergillus welwitschiae]|uniref:Uncharacterized protein n=1 Tax=Aspergillus welwitschiae TaxID=1341132 RepID=A0A3F3PQA4_9EURO|nr:hypothetical protein BDQ94DRAFT_151183 [Aspergillus welwitschiae]RDH28998.1 hypothetical protein BDQ94DRAFT_151183 [Aspergillus welwitschiae]
MFSGFDPYIIYVIWCLVFICCLGMLVYLIWGVWYGFHISWENASGQHRFDLNCLMYYLPFLQEAPNLWTRILSSSTNNHTSKY